MRLDQTIGSRLTVFARYNWAPSETITRNTSNLSLLNANRLRTQTLTLGGSATIRPDLADDFRVNYSGNGAYTENRVDDFGGAASAPRNTVIPSQFDSGTASGNVLFVIPGMTATSGAAGILVGGNRISSQRQFNVVDNVSYVLGTHQFRAGIDYRRLAPVVGFASYGLTAQFTSAQQIQAAAAGAGSVSSTLTLKPVFLNFSAYAEDTWRASRRLTISFGARWDVNPAPSEENGNDAAAVTEIGNLATLQLAPLGTKQWQTAFDQVAPRLGVAYQLSQAAGFETVLRGGFGVFYDTGNDFGAANFSSRFPYVSSRFTAVAFPLSPTQVAPAPLPIQLGLPTPYPNFLVFDPHLALPYTNDWNVAVEQSLGRNQALTLSYVGAAGRDLLQSTQLSLGNINPRFTSIQLTTNHATSDYHALQTQFQRRLSHGLQALASYTWSHSLDDDSTSQTGRVAKRGNAAFDVRHVFALAATYDLPNPANHLVRSILGYWSLDNNLRAQTGLPIDIVARTVTNPADGSLVSVRPNLNPGVPLYLSGAACAASNGGAPCPGGRRVNPVAFNANVLTGQSGTFG